MKPNFVEVSEYVHWDDEAEEWRIDAGFEYKEGVTYYFYCDVSNEMFEIVKDDSGELDVQVYCGECPWEIEEPECGVPDND